MAIPESEFYEDVIVPARDEIIENVYAILNGTTDEFKNIHEAVEEVLYGFCGHEAHQLATVTASDTRSIPCNAVYASLDDGEEIECSKDRGHDGRWHRSVQNDGAIVMWPND